jgi:hypothetical protein
MSENQFGSNTGLVTPGSIIPDEEFGREPAVLPGERKSLTSFDFTYVTDKLIAMGFPGGKRTPLDLVAKTLKAAHAGHFMVWNLSDAKYDYTALTDQVMEVKCRGHPAPRLKDIFNVCALIDTWLAGDDNNIAVIHCKSRGRTNMLCACYLAWSGFSGYNNLEALHYLSVKRGHKVPQMLIGSQRRYMSYFHNVMDTRGPHTQPLLLRRVIFHSVPAFTTKWVPTRRRTVLEQKQHRRLCAHLCRFYLKHNPAMIQHVDTLLTKFGPHNIACSLMIRYGKVPRRWRVFIRQRLESFYRKHNPTKLDQIPTLILRYKFSDLVHSLYRVYGVVPAGCELTNPPQQDPALAAAEKAKIDAAAAVARAENPSSMVVADNLADAAAADAAAAAAAGEEGKAIIDATHDATGGGVFNSLRKAWSERVVNGAHRLERLGVSDEAFALRKRQLSAFYMKHNPRKANPDDVDEILRNYPIEDLKVQFLPPRLITHFSWLSSANNIS